MKKFRKCESVTLNTGKSKCPIDLRKVVGALVVPHGVKLPADLTGEKLEEACHADPSQRVCPIFPFVEYAPNGGDVAVSSVGYGPKKATGVNDRTDTFTTEEYNELLASSLTKSMNTERDAYYFDDKNHLFGINDGTSELAGFPMSTIYHGGTPHPTSSALATQTINFCHKDARAAIEDFAYEILDFDPKRFAMGLVPVEFVKIGDSGNKYKLVEAQGGFDRTPEFGQLIASGATSVLKGNPTGVTYSADDETITVTGTPELKSPADLYSAGIKGIYGV